MQMYPIVSVPFLQQQCPVHPPWRGWSLGGGPQRSFHRLQQDRFYREATQAGEPSFPICPPGPKECTPSIRKLQAGTDEQPARLEEKAATTRCPGLGVYESAFGETLASTLQDYPSRGIGLRNFPSRATTLTASKTVTQGATVAAGACTTFRRLMINLQRALSELIDLRRHDEIALRQTVYLVGPELDLDLAPRQIDIRMVTLLLGDLSHTVYES